LLLAGKEKVRDRSGKESKVEALLDWEREEKPEGREGEEARAAAERARLERVPPYLGRPRMRVCFREQEAHDFVQRAVLIPQAYFAIKRDFLTCLATILYSYSCSLPIPLLPNPTHGRYQKGYRQSPDDQPLQLPEKC